jgi:MFS family permease
MSFQLLAGNIFDNYGPRIPLAIGSILHVVGLFAASFATEYYQVFLSRAVCSPLGASLIMSSAVAPVSHMRTQRDTLMSISQI